MSSSAGPSLCDWVATFEGLSRRCASMDDLADGVLLSEILAEIAPDHFSADGLVAAPSTWELRQQNLRTLNSSLEALFREDGHDGADFSDVNVTAIAKGADDGFVHLEKLTSRVLACVAMQGDVHSILDLDAATQRVLMQVIQLTMRDVPSIDDASSDDDKDAASVGGGDDDSAETSRLRSKLAEQQLHRRAVERELGEAKEAQDDLGRELEALRVERRQEQADWEEEKRRAARVEQRGSSSNRSRAQFDAERAQLQQTIDERTKERDTLKRQSESAIEASAAKARELSDELEIARESQAELAKVRRQCDKLKQKLEASDGLRQQLKELDAKCSEYLDRLLDAEGSADKLKSQLAAEKLRCAEAERLAASLREDAAAHESAHERTREQLDSTLQSNSEQARRLESLEARNDMLDFEDSGVGHSGGDTLSSEFGGGESLSGLAGGGDALQTRERIKRLERGNERLQREREEVVRRSETRVAQLEADLLEARGASSALSQSSAAAGSSRETALVEEIAILKRSSGMNRETKDRVKKQFMEQKKKILEQTQRINALEGLQKANVKLEHDVREKQSQLERRNAEQQKLEQYVKKALAHANETVKASQLKYKKSLEIYRKQVEEKKGEIEALHAKLESSKAAHKREGSLMMSQFYGMGLELNARLLAETTSSPRSTSSPRGVSSTASPATGAVDGGGAPHGSSPVGLLNQLREARKPRRRGGT